MLHHLVQVSDGTLAQLFSKYKVGGVLHINWQAGGRLDLLNSGEIGNFSLSTWSILLPPSRPNVAVNRR